MDCSLAGVIIESENYAETLLGTRKKRFEEAFVDVRERSFPVGDDKKLPFHIGILYLDLPKHVALKLIPHRAAGNNRDAHPFLDRLFNRIGRAKQADNAELLRIDTLL